jgi:hypothetical protein
MLYEIKTAIVEIFKLKYLYILLGKKRIEMILNVSEFALRFPSPSIPKENMFSIKNTTVYSRTSYVN